jgi:hypothetical protein
MTFDGLPAISNPALATAATSSATVASGRFIM